MRPCGWPDGLVMMWALHMLHLVEVDGVRRENRCMRHYFVHTIDHPNKNCERKNVLLARCEGYCRKSRTEPQVSFSPVLYRPFKYHCTCCRDRLSIMKAIKLKCEDDEHVYASYRYILRCGCEYCLDRW